MKQLLLALALVTTAATGASAADKLPSDMLGSWCLDSYDKNNTPTYKRGECDNVELITVGPGEFQGYELSCRALRTSHVKGGWIYRVRYRCAHGAIKPAAILMTFWLDRPPLPVRLTIVQER